MKPKTYEEVSLLLAKRFAEKERAYEAVARAPLSQKARLIGEWVEAAARVDQALVWAEELAVASGEEPVPF